MIASAFFQFIYSKRRIVADIKMNKVLRSITGWHEDDIHLLTNPIFRYIP